MCVEKTPWEQVVEFHGGISAEIALGYRAANIAAREMGIKPNHEASLLIKSEILSDALDAFQVMNQVTLGRGTLLVEDIGKHVYYFHYTGTQTVLRMKINKDVLDQISESAVFSNNREKQNKTVQAIEFLLALDESSFCSLTRQDGQILPIDRPHLWTTCSKCHEPVLEVSASDSSGQPVCLACC